MLTTWLLILSLSIPLPAPATKVPSTFKFTLATYVTLNLADYLTTRNIIHSGGTELNPFMRPIVKNDYAFLVVKTGLMVLSYVLLQKLYRANPKVAWVTSAALNIAMFLIVSHNMGEMR